MLVEHVSSHTQEREKKEKRKRRLVPSETESDKGNTSCSSVVNREHTVRKKKPIKTVKPDKSEAPTTAIESSDEESYSPNVPMGPPAYPAPPPTIQNLKVKSEQIQRSHLTFLTTPENLSSSNAVQFIIDKFIKTQGLLNEALIANSRLEGQISAVQNESAGQRKVFESSVRRTAATQLSPQRPMTFAERVGVKSKTAARSNLIQAPPNVITIVPQDTEVYDSSEKTKQAVLKLVSPKHEKIQVRSVRKIQGNGIPR